MLKKIESSSEEILGYKVINRGLKHSLQSIDDWIERGNSCRVLSCINPHSYAVSHGNSVFGHALHDADWLIPDGTGIVYASRWLKGGIEGRITGSDIFSGVHSRLQRIGGKSVFFLGASEEILEIIRQKMADDYPDIKISVYDVTNPACWGGTLSPGIPGTLYSGVLARLLICSILNIILCFMTRLLVFGVASRRV